MGTTEPSTGEDVIKTVSKIYSNALTDKPASFFQHENYKPQTDNIENYSLMEKIGQGKYSVVFEGVHEVTEEPVIIKILKPVKTMKINREIKILERLKYTANIVKLNCTIKLPEPNFTALVFEKLPNGQDFKTVYLKLREPEIRYYTYEILRALDYCHSQGIMHRDVKPSNIIIDRSSKRILLIDFGLAEFYLPGDNYNVRVASRHYKGPELLVDYNYYDYSLDLWSLGCMFASMLFRIGTFFMGTSNENQLLCIVKVLGSETFWNYLEKFAIKIQYMSLLNQTYVRQTWDRFITTENEHLVNEEALSLLDLFLKYDHTARITAKKAMKHKYFRCSPVKAEI